VVRRRTRAPRGTSSNASGQSCRERSLPVDGDRIPVSLILTRKRGRSIGGPPRVIGRSRPRFRTSPGLGRAAAVVSPLSPLKPEGAAEAGFEGPFDLVVFDGPLTTALARADRPIGIQGA